MKHRIKKLCSLIIALSMLLSLMPLYGAAVDDEFAGLETLEEIPFEFELEPGDLPFELLKDAVLAPEDIPSCIAPALVEERGHVNRLYLQEPDDYTVMFQNRDGSKTVYVFSHPVKGMTTTTAASIQVNGSLVSFTGDNAITSRIAELSSFNIGSAEIAYIPTGILSSDGIDLTEDARGWADGESIAAELSYNISSEAAAEYAASVTVPDTEVAVAALTPEVTITPITPSPLGGTTVMSISYSDLAGLMSFKNVSTNQYLALSTSSSLSLTTASAIVMQLAQWAVQYDSFFGYVISNLSDPYHTYLGFDDTDAFIIDSLSYMMLPFSLSITSTANSTVTIDCGEIAIDSDTSFYELDDDELDFPASCEWKIMRKTALRLVTSISVPETTRIEQSGVGFYLDYTLNPLNATHYDVGLYYASTGQSVEHDTEIYEDDEYQYYVNTPGEYTVYYKDNITGIHSPNFTLKIVKYVTGITIPSSTRIEQKGVGFTLDYEYEPEDATPVSISLYYADTNTEVPHTGNTYTISTPGIYTVYYMDSESGVRSVDFTIVIYEIPDFTIANSLAEPTFSIKPVDAPSKYLTMNVASNGTTFVTIEEYAFDDISLTYTNNGERWDSLSRAFTITSTSNFSSSYHITSILTKNQYDFPSASVIHYISYSGGDYYRTECDTKQNTLDIVKTNDTSVITTNTRTSVTNGLTIVAVDDYYLIFSRSTDSNTIANNVALKYDTDLGVTADTFVATDTSFRWKIDQIGVNAPLIRQTQQYTCGPATFLQVLYGAGYGTLVPERTDTNANKIDLHQQMMTLAYTAEMGKNQTILPYTQWNDTYEGHWMGGTTQEDFAGRINEYSLFDNNATGQYLRWEKDKPGNIGKAEIKDSITTSLLNGWAPFVWTDTGGTPYKLGPGGGHYICIIGFEEISPTEGYVIIANCHYHDNVLGIYAVLYSEFYEKIGEVYYYEP